MISQEDLKKRLRYCPETGEFTHLLSHRGPVKAGDKCSYISGGGRLQVKIRGKRYSAHRLAWLYMTGDWPPEGLVIDHINGNCLDNRWGNLRLATRAQNTWHSRKLSTNTSGFRGVSWSKSDKKWRSCIWLNNKQIFLGYYEDPAEASRVYEAAKERLHGKEWMGRP